MDKNKVDGMHSVNDLIDYRSVLLIKVMQDHLQKSWISPFHYDNTKLDGYFVAGISTPSGLLTFHIPTAYWDLAVQTQVRVLPSAIRGEDMTHADKMKKLLQWVSYQRKSSSSGVGSFTDFVASLSTARNTALDQLKPPSK